MAELDAVHGLRLGVEQERRLRRWPTARIRPKTVALGVLSLLAEVDALRVALAEANGRVEALEEALRPVAVVPIGDDPDRLVRLFLYREAVERACALLADRPGEGGR